jgi:hypothetical protein
MDILAFLIMVLLLVGIGRMVLATLAIQKNTREVADYFNWLRERQELQAAKQKPIMRPGEARPVYADALARRPSTLQGKNGPPTEADAPVSPGR